MYERERFVPDNEHAFNEGGKEKKACIQLLFSIRYRWRKIE
jgi:hypothetical protein